MAKKPENTAPAERDDSEALEMIAKEMDALRDLYMHAESSAQNMFNYYLTLLSTIVGGVVLLFQLGRDDRSTSLTLGVILFFAAMIGAVYLSAVTARYGHMARYARAIDALRRVTLQRGKGLLPPLYQPFLSKPAPAARSDTRLKPTLMWLLPSGSFQFFMAVINSVALGMGTWFVMRGFGVAAMLPVRTGIASWIVAVVAFNVFNIYSQVVGRTTMERLNVDIFVSDQLPFLAGRQ